MASRQASISRNDHDEKEIVLAMVEKSKSIGKSKSKNVVNKQSLAQNSAVVTINNTTTGLINFNQSYDWAGSIVGDTYPVGIFSGKPGTFTHAGQTKDGSQGAVVYSGNNKQGIPCGWLLAWIAPTNNSTTTPNRVYVECGPVANYDIINWIAIKSKLNVANDYDNYFDPATQTTIAAQLTPSGGFAALGANFGAIVQNCASAVMNNDSKSITMVLYQSYDWYGSVSGPYPYGITPSNYSQFVHRADLTNGSKGAVVYYGTINPTTEGAWLLAWSAPTGTDSIPPNNQPHTRYARRCRLKSSFSVPRFATCVAGVR
ncbi:jasmonate-induced protein homolog isoform X2 [Spinacia oleracea]|uniref:Jasmonate-induced protein homolog isoform X2 n=1 Tax=Spinacia oleracea TaxID=3562 RepID=A0ABM3RGG6_SPIOL|nr:jasmonate-induced protein homolog isoform X2 [Spinacia oleracea]